MHDGYHEALSTYAKTACKYEKSKPIDAPSMAYQPINCLLCSLPATLIPGAKKLTHKDLEN